MPEPCRRGASQISYVQSVATSDVRSREGCRHGAIRLRWVVVAVNDRTRYQICGKRQVTPIYGGRPW